MAEGFLKSIITNDEYLSKIYTTASVGISANMGDCACRYAIGALMTGWGIDISGHCVSRLHKEDIEASFLILTMTRSLKEYILSTFSVSNRKVFTLNEYAYKKSLHPEYLQCDYSLDISDPYGMTLQVYNQCAIEIKQAIDKLIEKLKK